jgi:hypothetical protein
MSAHVLIHLIDPDSTLRGPLERAMKRADWRSEWLEIGLR